MPKCPACGADNPVGAEECQSCQTVFEAPLEAGGEEAGQPAAATPPEGEAGEEAAAEVEQPSAQPAASAPPAAAPSVARRLVVTRGRNVGKEFPLEAEGQYVIGRYDPSRARVDIDLTDHDEEPWSVHRQHVVLTVSGDKVTIEDIGGGNPVFVNRGAALEAGKQYEINPGDLIILGQRVFLEYKAD